MLVRNVTLEGQAFTNRMLSYWLWLTPITLLVAYETLQKHIGILYWIHLIPKPSNYKQIVQHILKFPFRSIFEIMPIRIDEKGS